MPLKKRRLVNGKELVFRKPGEETDEDGDEDEDDPEEPALGSSDEPPFQPAEPSCIATEQTIIIHEDD